MPIYWLDPNSLVFPPAHLASEEGIIAVGGDLSAARLLEAYRLGIFPWFNEDDPILWWTPDPRFVLFPEDLKVAKSMRPLFNQKTFTLSMDQAFPEVIKACQSCYRPGQGGTWITEEMREAYIHLHNQGYAHSVEVWQGEDLVGGLYGIALGKVFYGESMFAFASNASKFGFISLVRQLKKWGFTLIDCQQETNHLASLGAKAIPRKQFLAHLQQNPLEATKVGSWHFEETE